MQSGREDLRIIQQLKGDASTRQKLSETQCSRLNDRQKVSEAKIQELRGELTRLSMQQHREQESRAQVVSQMAATIQVRLEPSIPSPPPFRLPQKALARCKVVEGCFLRCFTPWQCNMLKTYSKSSTQ